MNLIKMTDSSKPSDYFFDYVKACARQLPTQALVDELTEGVFEVLQKVNKKAKSLSYQPTPMTYQYPPMQPPVQQTYPAMPPQYTMMQQPQTPYYYPPQFYHDHQSFTAMLNSPMKSVPPAMTIQYSSPSTSRKSKPSHTVSQRPPSVRKIPTMDSQPPSVQPPTSVTSLDSLDLQAITTPGGSQPAVFRDSFISECVRRHDEDPDISP
jgi:hypothetical protein